MWTIRPWEVPNIDWPWHKSDSTSKEFSLFLSLDVFLLVYLVGFLFVCFLSSFFVRCFVLVFYCSRLLE